MLRPNKFRLAVLASAIVVFSGTATAQDNGDTVIVTVAQRICSDADETGARIHAIVSKASIWVDESRWPPDSVSALNSPAIVAVIPRDYTPYSAGLYLALDSIQIKGRMYSAPGEWIGADPKVYMGDGNARCVAKGTRLSFSLLDGALSAVYVALRQGRQGTK